MTPFKRVTIPYANVVKMADELLAKLASFFEPDLGPNPSFEAIAALIDRCVKEWLEEVVFANDTYQVTVRPTDDLIHLSIKRLDRKPIHDWRDLQEIKNELVGVENEAVELYPAESRRVDLCNQYHLWVLQDASVRFPFGFQTRYVTDTERLGGSVQRSFK